MIVGKGRHLNERSIMQVENGKYIGYGYFEPEFVNADPEILRDHIKPRIDNRDVQKIIRHFLNTTSSNNILKY